jgi:hypothetical protein
VTTHGDGRRAEGCIVRATIHATAAGVTVIDRARGPTEVSVVSVLSVVSVMVGDVLDKVCLRESYM